MRVRYYFLIFLVFLIAGALFAAGPFVLVIAKKQLARQFPAAQVSIRGDDVDLFHSVVLRDVQIKQGRNYAQIESIDIEYSLAGLIKKRIHKVSLKNANVKIDEAKKTILDLKIPTDNSPREDSFTVETVEFQQARFEILLQDLKTAVSGSGQFNLYTNTIVLDAQIPSLDYKGAVFKKGELKITREGNGHLSVEEFNYNKLKVKGIQGRLRLEDQKLVADSLSSNTLNGKIEGDITFAMNMLADYRVNLWIVDLDIEQLVHDFELNNKFSMTGLLKGNLVLTGVGSQIKVMSGDMTLGETGGFLTIKDTKMLENVAKSSNLPPELVLESLQNYTYNVGSVKSTLEQGTVVLNISLDGKNGKRNFIINLHDIF